MTKVLPLFFVLYCTLPSPDLYSPSASLNVYWIFKKKKKEKCKHHFWNDLYPHTEAELSGSCLPSIATSVNVASLTFKLQVKEVQHLSMSSRAASLSSVHSPSPVWWMPRLHSVLSRNGTYPELSGSYDFKDCYNSFLTDLLPPKHSPWHLSCTQLKEN